MSADTVMERARYAVPFDVNNTVLQISIIQGGVRIGPFFAHRLFLLRFKLSLQVNLLLQDGGKWPTGLTVNRVCLCVSVVSPPRAGECSSAP